MKKLFNEEYYKRLIKGAEKSALWFLIFTLIFTVAISLNVGSIADFLNKYSSGSLENIISTKAPDEKIGFLPIFINNIRATIMIFIFGIVPFLYLPIVFGMLVNASNIATIVGYAIYGGGLLHGIKLLFIGLVPHGILEILAFFIAAGAVIELCNAIVRKLKNKEDQIMIKDAFINGIKVLLVICLPLIFIGALVEGYITPILLDKFFWIR